jgi:hypothetical protein
MATARFTDLSTYRPQTAHAASVIGLARHYTGEAFAHNWMTHLGPVYLTTILFVVGAGPAYRGFQTE